MNIVLIYFSIGIFIGALVFLRGLDDRFSSGNVMVADTLATIIFWPGVCVIALLDLIGHWIDSIKQSREEQKEC